MTDAFGVVALVALTPLLAIQLMGLQYKLRLKNQKQMAQAESIPDDADTIIEMEE